MRFLLLLGTLYVVFIGGFLFFLSKRKSAIEDNTLSDMADDIEEEFPKLIVFREYPLLKLYEPGKGVILSLGVEEKNSYREKVEEYLRGDYAK
jgi:hypothetical protein